MDIEPDRGGKLFLDAAQERWSAGREGKAAGVIETSLFAGQRLIAITDDKGRFDLLYLGFTATGFDSMDAAKRAAPEFARRVLALMSEMISA